MPTPAFNAGKNANAAPPGRQGSDALAIARPARKNNRLDCTRHQGNAGVVFPARACQIYMIRGHSSGGKISTRIVAKTSRGPGAQGEGGRARQAQSKYRYTHLCLSRGERRARVPRAAGHASRGWSSLTAKGHCQCGSCGMGSLGQRRTGAAKLHLGVWLLPLAVQGAAGRRWPWLRRRLAGRGAGLVGWGTAHTARLRCGSSAARLLWTCGGSP